MVCPGRPAVLPVGCSGLSAVDPTHYDTLYGLQGRYFLPVLPLLLLVCLPRKLAHIPDEEKASGQLMTGLALVQFGVLMNSMLAVIAK